MRASLAASAVDYTHPDSDYTTSDFDLFAMRLDEIDGQSHDRREPASGAGDDDADVALIVALTAIHHVLEPRAWATLEARWGSGSAQSDLPNEVLSFAANDQEREELRAAAATAWVETARAASVNGQRCASHRLATDAALAARCRSAATRCRSARMWAWTCGSPHPTV